MCFQFAHRILGLSHLFSNKFDGLRPVTSRVCPSALFIARRPTSTTRSCCLACSPVVMFWLMLVGQVVTKFFVYMYLLGVQIVHRCEPAALCFISLLHLVVHCARRFSTPVVERCLSVLCPLVYFSYGGMCVACCLSLVYGACCWRLRD